MTSRRKIVGANLSILGGLVSGAIMAYAVVQGSLGALFHAKGLREGSSSERLKAATALQSFGSSGAPAVPAAPPPEECRQSSIGGIFTRKRGRDTLAPW
jgi:hypothetical protein